MSGPVHGPRSGGQLAKTSGNLAHRRVRKSSKLEAWKCANLEAFQCPKIATDPLGGKYGRSRQIAIFPGNQCGRGGARRRGSRGDLGRSCGPGFGESVDRDIDFAAIAWPRRCGVLLQLIRVIGRFSGHGPVGVDLIAECLLLSLATIDANHPGPPLPNTRSARGQDGGPQLTKRSVERG